MRTDKYMMAKAWMKQDQAPQSEALDTWNTLEAEFNEERKAMLMASAETDAIKEAMNKKFGPGTVKYGSEIKQPEIKTPQAIFEFSQRNPAAEGGRMGFLSGGDVEKIIKIYKAGSEGNYRTSADFIANKIGKKFGSVSKSSVGKKLAELFADGTLTKQEEIKSSKVDGKRKIYKVIREITNQDRITNPDIPKNAKFKVQLPGKTGVEMKYASTENILQKAIDASDDYVANVMNAENSARMMGNDRGFKIGNETGLQFGKGQKSAITPEMIKLNTDIIDEIAKTKILDVRTLADTFDMSLKDMNQKLTNFVRQYYYNRIGTGGVYLNKYDDSFLSDVLGKINKSDFQNQYERTMNELVSKSYPKESKNLTAALDNLKNYHKTNKLIAEKFPSLYSTLDHSVPYTYIRDITEAGSNPKNLIKVRPIPQEANTFKTLIDRRSIDLGKKLKVNPKDAELLKDFKDLNFIKKSIPLEFGTTTSTGKVVSYANQALSGKTDLVEGIVKGNAQFNELIDFSKNLDPKSDLAKLLTKSEKTQLSKISTITKVDDKELREFIKSVGCPNFKAAGGRIEFESGGDCFDKGQKLINSGMKGASPGSMKNAAKFLNNAYKFGRNVMKFGIIPEAIFVGAESIIRAGGDQTLDEGFKSAIGFYLDPILGTNFKSDARISQNLRNMTQRDTMDLEKLFKFNTATENLNKLKENQKNVLNVYDESLMGGVSEQDYKKQSDANIAKAQEELNKNFLTETQRVDFENKADTSEDIKGVRSPFRQAIGKARSDTEMMRYEDDFSGMQSDMFSQDPMSAKAKKDSLSNLLPQKGMTPRLSNFVNFDDRQIEQLSGLTKKPVKELQAYQEYLNKERGMSLLDQERIFGKEQTYGTQGNFFGEKIKQKPMYDYAEGGIIGLRSKYEYKK